MTDKIRLILSGLFTAGFWAGYDRAMHITPNDTTARSRAVDAAAARIVSLIGRTGE